MGLSALFIAVTEYLNSFAKHLPVCRYELRLQKNGEPEQKEGALFFHLVQNI